jgi:hypothetical protein
MSLPEEQRVPERHSAEDIDRVRALMRASEAVKPSA